MSQNPRRIVLRVDEQYELQHAEIVEAFFTSYDDEPDFYQHLCPPNRSTKMHTVLDLHCKPGSSVELQSIPYEVFRVKKSEALYVYYLPANAKPGLQNSHFTRLGDSASTYARQRCSFLAWGTNRAQSDEWDGVRLAHAGHSPSRLVS